MNAPLFHIGYHKTATSWFQQVFYPRVRNRRYVPQVKVRSAFLAPHALHFDPAQARHVIGERYEGLICCEENLTGGLHSGGLAGCQSKDMALRIRAAYPDAHIVIFIRDQVEAIASAYVQYVKGGGTHAIDRYLFGGERLGPRAPERDEIPRFRFEHFAYDRLIAHYDTLFGEERVHVYRYEDFRADRRAFLTRYARRHGLDVAIDEIELNIVNPGLGLAALLAMRMANFLTRRAVADKGCLLHVPGWYKISRRAMRRLASSGWSGRPARADEIMPATLIQAIGHRFRESNLRLEERLRRQQSRCREAAESAIIPTPALSTYVLETR